MRTRTTVAVAAGATAPIAAAIGAVLAWLFDPDRGKARRRKLADQAAAVGRRQLRRLGALARYQRGRLRGDLLRATGAGIGAPGDDVDVKQQIHQALHAAGVSMSEISVEVSDRRAVLRGQVATTVDLDRIRGLTAAVRGVHEVESYLHLPGEPAPNKAEALRVSTLRR